MVAVVEKMSILHLKDDLMMRLYMMKAGCCLLPCDC